MDSDATGVSDAVVDALMRASRALVDVTARSLSSVNEDVTTAQLRTLIVLSQRGPQTVTALADQLNVHASTMTRMCTRLVSRGLVARVPSAVDRREVVISLSSTGSDLVDEVVAKRREEFEQIVRRLSHDEQQACITALEAFSSAASDTTSSLGKTEGDAFTNVLLADQED
ncbi:MAG TPA: MarR family transcriptional regulator [Acidimicrobiia bacterium]|jgi:DNA-binding MarR family transcriptional regulator|nr:MarR family transcriptional regulator [Acidimicrobiia bacterium]